ncbi:helix-hairpin-helix domain-containing protein, partial [Streptomyces sp. MCAF7]
MYEGVVQDLIDELGRLPGVGPKSAQRIAFHILQATARQREIGSGVYEGVVQDLIDELGRLPGVGPKSAQRIAFHILQA